MENKRWISTAFAFITAQNDDGTFNKANKPPFGYFLKPVNQQLLVEAIEDGYQHFQESDFSWLSNQKNGANWNINKSSFKKNALEIKNKFFRTKMIALITSWKMKTGYL